MRIERVQPIQRDRLARGKTLPPCTLGAVVQHHAVLQRQAPLRRQRRRIKRRQQPQPQLHMTQQPPLLAAPNLRAIRELPRLAQIVHDLGKTREFTYGAEIGRSEEGRLLGHVQLGLRLLAPLYPSALAPERRLALEHCVMLHHGPEGAGGQRFASGEAIALYRLNALDAHLKGAFEQGVV